MIYLNATIFTKPTPKGRPRFGKGRTYTPAKTVKAEAIIREAIKTSMPKEPIESPVSLLVVFFHKMPKSWSQKKRDLMLGKPKTSKPDADNLLKLVKDSLQGFVKDDSYITDAHVKKFWGDVDCVRVRMSDHKERVVDFY